MIEPNFPEQFHSAQEIFDVAEPIVGYLEKRLNAVHPTKPSA
jgi:hypothetical protein